MLKNMRFNLNENLLPAEKAHLLMLMTSIGRPDMISKVVAGELTRNEVKDLIAPLKTLVANCENDKDPNSSAVLIGPVAGSILGKFEKFLG